MNESLPHSVCRVKRPGDGEVAWGYSNCGNHCGIHGHPHAYRALVDLKTEKGQEPALRGSPPSRVTSMCLKPGKRVSQSFRFTEAEKRLKGTVEEDYGRSNASRFYCP